MSLWLDRRRLPTLRLDLLARARDAEVERAMAGWTLRSLGLEVIARPPPVDLQSWGSELLYRGPDAAVSAFELTARHRIPVHDHPGMSVWMRVLSGRVRVTSWRRDGAEAVDSDVRSISASDPVFLATAAGDLHQLEAIDDTVFVDVLRPPYTNERPCTYWRLEGPGPRYRLRSP